MHSGRGAEASPLAAVAAAARVLASRSPIGGVRLAGALLALAILALSLFGGCSAEPSAEPTVRSFLLAWEENRYWDAASYTTGPRGEAAAVLRGEYQQLGAAALFLNMGSITAHGDRADAHFSASVDLGQDGAPWRYEGNFALRRVGTNWKIVWSPSVINPHLRAGLRLAVITTVPNRAAVLDSAGRPLVRLTLAYEVGVQPDRLRQPSRTAAKLAAVTGLDADRVLSQIRSAQPTRFQELLTLTPRGYAALRHRLSKIPGVMVLATKRRLFSSEAQGIVGTVVTENAALLRQEGLPYQPGTTVGKSGLQQVYQRRLAGTPTTEVVVENRRGYVVSVLQKWPGQRPAGVRTTIDARIQAAATHALRWAPGAAAIVAVQASTGHILAVSDRAGDGRSMLNASLEGRYPPGDSFTIVSGAALLNTGFTVDTQIPCAQTKNVGGQTFTNDQPEESIGPEPPFRVDFARACDTAFAGLSRLLTASELRSAAARFGIGARWQLPLPAFTGTVPVPNSDAELAAETIGEGGVRVSPLAMALVAAEVRSGSWHRPVLVTSPPDPANVPVTPFRPQLMSVLRSLMRGTVTFGAAGVANLAGEPLYAQVGSAPAGKGSRLEANWFVGFRGDMAFAVLTLSRGAGASATVVGAQFLQDIAS